MKTRITELFNIEHPIIQGGMHFVGFSELVAAVSNAGGLGIITALTQPTPKDLANEIAKCHDMTDKPFGVNLTFIPSFKDPPYDEYIDAIIQGGIKIVETAGRNPEKYMPQLKDAGIKVIHKCTSVRHSLKAEAIGCDAVSVDGEPIKDLKGEKVSEEEAGVRFRDAGMDPDKAAKIILRGIKKNKKRIFVGIESKLMELSQRLFPDSYLKIMPITLFLGLLFSPHRLKKVINLAIKKKA